MRRNAQKKNMLKLSEFVTNFLCEERNFYMKSNIKSKGIWRAMVSLMSYVMRLMVMVVLTSAPSYYLHNSPKSAKNLRRLLYYP